LESSFQEKKLATRKMVRKTKIPDPFIPFFRDVCEHFDRRGSFLSRLLAQAVLSGKVRNLGHQKGWIAVE
jgi:hypothetical protein